MVGAVSLEEVMVDWERGKLRVRQEIGAAPVEGCYDVSSEYERQLVELLAYLVLQ